MSGPQAPEPVKLFIGAIYAEEEALAEARPLLEKELGDADYQSPAYPFTFSDYYKEELGEGQKRILLSFRRLFMPEAVVGAKHFCARLERRLSREGKRRINLDPGYQDLYKVVLMSYKHGGQKIYLFDGVYADVVLLYNKGKYEPFIWTFPDFKGGTYDEALREIRRLYKEARRGAASPA